MARISYSKAAMRDLEHIGDYIANQLRSPQAALNTVRRIQNAIDKLADFPLMGAPLSSRTEIETVYRFLVCGNYLAFYRPKDSEVSIERIIYGKRDYLAVLFRDLKSDD